ncbi:MAG: hypothetical protein AB7O38_07845, partial [Pirellulaceae bacterium]
LPQMAVRCAHCGEELLGAVNRCWRCGKALAVHAGPIDIPPVRRPPPGSAPALAAPVPISAREPTLTSPRRRGSPFASADRQIPGQAPQPVRIRSSSPYPSPHVALQLVGRASWILSVCSLVLCGLFPWGAVLVAVAAMVFAAISFSASSALRAWLTVSCAGFCLLASVLAAALA